MLKLKITHVALVFGMFLGCSKVKRVDFVGEIYLESPSEFTHVLLDKMPRAVESDMEVAWNHQHLKVANYSAFFTGLQGSV